MTLARKVSAAVLAGLMLASPALAQAPPNYMGRVGGVTKEVCVSPTVTASSAYTAGNAVGALITFPSAFLSANSGILHSVRLTSKSVQTAEFDVSFFSALPTTAFADKTAPAIAAADVALVQPPIKLTNNYSGLGTHTVYGADGISRPVNTVGTSAYALIITTGTPTFTSASDIQLCASWLQD
jgi:hypothetical protein